MSGGDRRDWLELGRDLGFLQESAAAGLTWLPRGELVLHLLDLFWREATAAAGFAQVRSGGPDPLAAHLAVFAAGTRSWRELPFRLVSLGVTTSFDGGQAPADSLTCVAAPDQIPAVLAGVIRLAEDAVAAFGFEQLRYRLTDLDTDSGMPWRQALGALGRPAVADARGTAVDGAVLTIEVRDSRARWWPTSRFALAAGLSPTFATGSGERQTAVVVHGALLGDWQRWLAAVLEHGDGGLPLWLAPEQVRVLPVGPAGLPAARQLAEAGAKQGLRMAIEVEGALATRVKAAMLARVPCLAVVGAREAAAGVVAVRRRGSAASVAMAPATLLARVVREAARHGVGLDVTVPAAAAKENST